MLVECVPNFSEGRDPAVIARLEAAARAVPGVALLDRHSDPDHHRTVLTFAGAPAAVLEAAFRTCAEATRSIDMTRHQGAHPRLGAADVVPFVPLRGATLADCSALAERLAERLASELGLPVYLYGASARRPERRRLPWLREPEFEGLAGALASPERAPDVGPARPHPTAGATVTGGRPLLVAFNVDLRTDDVRIARRIARAVRESSGGLPGVQAKGLWLPLQARVQVTMNLVDVEQTGRAFAEVARLAAAEGVLLAGSELVGLLPRRTATEVAGTLLRLRPAPGARHGAPALEGRVLEDRLETAGLYDPADRLDLQLAAIASPERLAPGGGSAVATGLALGVACLRKALALSETKGALTPDDRTRLLAALPADATLLELAREDHLAFAGLMAALGLPKTDPARPALVEAARARAVAAPAHLIRVAVGIAEAAAEVAARGNPGLVNDAQAAAELALVAVRIAAANGRANRKGAPDAAEEAALARAEAAAGQARGR